jgi:hypothetical protein
MARPKKDNTIKEEEKTLIDRKEMSDEQQLEGLQTEIDKARVELERTRLEIQEKKKELQYSGRREIDADERALIDKQVSRINEKKTSEDVVAKQKLIDNEQVTGRFMNRRNPGQSIKLPYIKYADDPVRWWHFEEGKVYTIPRGFADQINEHYHMPRFIQKDGIQAPDGTSAIHSVDTSNKKYAFVPVGF